MVINLLIIYMGNQQYHTYVTPGSRNEPPCRTYVTRGSERVNKLE